MFGELLFAKYEYLLFARLLIAKSFLVKKKINNNYSYSLFFLLLSYPGKTSY